MKSLFLFCIFLMIVGCSDNDKSNVETPVPLQADVYPQKWLLTAMTGSIANVPPTTGEDLEYQETIRLHSDGTFTKIREYDGVTLQASGAFEVVEKSDGDYLILTFPEKNALVGNCSNEPKEWFRFDSDTKLIGTWWACDGPGLFYDRVE
ncbi:hypothetical protein FK220_001745 [Flavobacteriaceae bacterium TP-CH-4]|uniref:Uncharacterized protein n=1 Tax=Pelagihabitans pacificus TaxID=2696054 RepID=A0A967ARV2_9FLAO|nr:hypothetical protein [Pelagihabitans pacificus]NHF58045.1 hypothetical protein [Pelagihabitans pacificus]